VREQPARMPQAQVAQDNEVACPRTRIPNITSRVTPNAGTEAFAIFAPSFQDFAVAELSLASCYGASGVLAVRSVLTAGLQVSWAFVRGCVIRAVLHGWVLHCQFDGESGKVLGVRRVCTGLSVGAQAR